MKKLVSFIIALAISMQVFGQVDEVTVNVVGVGNSEGDATNVAFRSAIEQAFGVFVSSNTRLLDDNLQEDMVNISNGYIKRYEKLAVAPMPQGRVSVSIKATVSVNKLISYTKSKGARAEFAGDTYAANVKLMKLKASSAKKAMDIIIDQLDHFKNMMFDFELVLGQPKLASEWGSYSYLANNYIFEGEVNVYTNAYSSNFYTLLASTLNAIELSEQEAMQFKNAGVPATKIIDFFGIKGRRTYPLPWNDAEQYEEKVISIILKSSHRYSVVEIQNPSNKFYWKNDGFLSKDGKYTIRCNPKMHNMIFEPCNRHFNSGVRCDGLVSEKFKIKEVRIPLTLTKKEQKEVEKGTFTGPTYRVEYGEQKLLGTQHVLMFIPEDRMNSFKGFELVGQSVHGPGNPEKKESANEGTTTVRRATSSSYR